MSTNRPFAYNLGLPISGTTQLGDLAIGVDNLDYSEQPGGVQWWNGPDEDLGYIIAHPTPAGNQPNQLGIPAYLGFWRSKLKTEPSFIIIAQWVSAKHGSPQIFATGMDAATWLNNNGYWTSYNQNVPTPTPTATQPIPTLTPTPTSTPVVVEIINPIITSQDEYIEVGDEIYLMFNESVVPTLTPTPDVTPTLTPTPTETQPEPTPTPTGTQPEPTPTPTGTQPEPTPTPTGTQPEPTPTETQPIPTPTPTPTETSLPVTGYSFNLVDLPYNFPSSGNTIINNESGIQTGSTEINELSGASRGLYFNTIDLDGVDRTSYFSAFTGQNITVTFNQNGNVAIYSGDTDSFKYWEAVGGDDGFVFGTGIGIPSSPVPSGNATLLQSSPVNYTIGLPVYISISLDTPPTPTPTPTMSTPTPTPTSGATGDGWLFYTPEGTLLGPPSSSGQTVFVIQSEGVSTFNPNYTGSNMTLYFNEYTTDGVSYNTEFLDLDTNGGTITITQNSDSVTYSGTALNFQYGVPPNNFLGLQVNNSSQLISQSAAPFVSGSPINLIII